LTGLLNSDFYAYLNLMLGSSTGIEREQVYPTSAIKYPAIKDKQIAKLVEKIQNVKRKNNDLLANPETNQLLASLEKKLNHYIFSSFNLADDPFINYVLKVQIPLLTGNSSHLYKSVTTEELQDYTKIFLKYWEQALMAIGMFIKITIYPSIQKKYSAIEVEFVNSQPEQLIKIKNKHDHLKLLTRFMLAKYNDVFYQKKNIINFEDKSFYILKTNEYKNWHPAIGEMDLSKVIDSIFRGSRELL